VTRRWTLIYNGKAKLYILREYIRAGEEWHRIAMLEYTELSSALAKIRETEAADKGR
jgi:predicted mannosyl-3-phosphoglycerate phosphatase (HAD superfamily)